MNAVQLRQFTIAPSAAFFPSLSSQLQNFEQYRINRVGVKFVVQDNVTTNTVAGLA
jgi:hypothetical protein